MSDECLAVLTKARELLSDRLRWTMEARARRAGGDPVHPADPSAVCWCLEGAVGISANDGAIIPHEILQLLDKAAIELFANQLLIEHVSFDTGDPEPEICDYFAFQSASYVNDHLGYEASLAVLDRAICLAQKR